MNFSIAFRNLPFTPVNSQVIYVENEFSESCNSYIRLHFRTIENHCRRLNKEFVYLPYITLFQNIEERVRYYAPYLKSDIVFPELPKSDTLLQYMANSGNRSQIKPSIIWFDSQEGEDYIFNGINIETDDDFYWQFGNIPPKTSHHNAVLYSVRDDDEISLCQDARFEESRLFEKRESKAREEITRQKEEEEAIRRAEEEARKKAEGERIRKENSLSAKLRRGTRSFFKKMVEEEEDGGDNDVCYSTRNYDEECHRPTVVTEELTPYTDDIDVEDTIRDLERTVARLQLKGITLAAIHEMIDKQEKLSHMVITPDYRIFLPDYGNREIEITPIAKALYFLFLRYPDGIRIKELADHHKELFNIYRQLKPNFNEAKMDLTITKITNPFGNRIHEAISVIRAAFLREFDEHLAQHYFITGIAGEEYKITLDRDLIEWQEEE